MSISQQTYKLEKKLAVAKKSLELAKKSSSDELKLKEEYEKKKEALWVKYKH